MRHRRRRHPRRTGLVWLMALGWVLLAAAGAWVVGYALALRGNPARFVDGHLELMPFAYGGWFGLLVLVAGGWSLRRYRLRRAAPRSDETPADPS